MLDFFSLGKTFLGIGMRLGGGIMQFKMFGNLAHLTARLGKEESLGCL